MDRVAVTCPGCGGPMEAWRQVESSEPTLGPRTFALARCRQCGTAVTLGAAVPEAHSAGAYGGGRPRGARLVAPLLSRFDRRRLALLRTRGGVPAGARLIDAGAGRGRFVTTALAAGYDAVGVEPSLRDVDPAVPIHAVEIADAPIPEGSADAVTLWHVLEHLEDPAAALAVLHRWLVPGGVLLVGVPNLGSLQSRFAGGRWYHLDLPRHRTHFSVPGLTQLLAASGFEVVAVQHILAEQNWFGMWQSLVSRATRHPSYLYNLLKHNAPLASPDLLVTLLALPWLPFAVLLELAAGAARSGGSVAVVARRL